MSEVLGLRERKKLQTRRVISDAAIELFLSRGFDAVSVADVAAAAEVSNMTVFNYFPTKEDLVLHRVEDHFDEAAATVRARQPDETPLAALRRHFLAGLDARDATTGLNDQAEYISFQRMVLGSPRLWLRMVEQASRMEDSLSAAFAEIAGAGDDDITPRIAASQVIAVQQALVVHNLRNVLAGATADALHDRAVADANRAFDLLEHGLSGSSLAD
ncbi:TetR/AcrR family transcriptional regulator [Streptomyces inhibens]|uniref:TetR/AcrR family transcriptional regulator n=1 Tax=Streptomyces inhibens TaxID=2293571 RepID=UPI001EE727F1|nr:TetR family transcriptional regulator [Streptomyces inhibens]UKY51775.1 TetR/AcrR family transcriptional regulator [Streptomyces inhibens]